jgi:tripartite-type tricarboxylate transporter receptor subunit TctC
MKRRTLLQATPLLFGLSESAQAQAPFPNKPIRYIVPVAAGGGSDMICRTFCERFGKVLNQTVVVDNQSGGGGVIAAQATARAASDGYTLMQGYVATHATAPATRKLAYDPIKDFTPITLISKVPSLYVVHPDLPVKNLKEFVAYAKANPAQLNYGSAGNGSAGHLAFEYLKMTTETFVLHVPYRGTGPMLTDLLAGRLQAAAVGAPALLQFIKAGKLRCIATGTSTRLPQLPDVATVAEQGYKGFEMTQWYGLLAPSKMVKANIDKLEKEAIAATRGKIVNDKLSQDTALAVGNTRAEFEAFIKLEQARWKPVITRAQIKPEGV